MKKLYVYVALAAMGVMAACSKNDNVDPQGNGGNTVIDDNSPVAVELGVKGIDLDVNVSSKAQGSVDAWDASQTLYVYAIDRSDAQFANTPLIDNISASSPATGAQNNVLNLVKPASAGEYAGEYFYFQGSTVYDFYGYYVDDAVEGTPTPSRDGGTITLPITITGAQDIMLAKADPAVDIEASNDPNKGQVTSETAYSAFAARRGVQPTLEFQHQLARFTFNIVPGSASGDLVTVTAIELQSNTTGTLQIAPAVEVGQPTILNQATLAYLSLANEAEGTQGANNLPYNVPEYTGADQEALKVGESLMVMPGQTSYNLRVSMTQDGNVDTDLPVNALETVIAATNVDTNNDGTVDGVATFEAGKTYEITIKVYGMERIEVSATLKAWEDGGSVVIDPDQDMIPGQDDEEEVIEPEP